MGVGHVLRKSTSTFQVSQLTDGDCDSSSLANLLSTPTSPVLLFSWAVDPLLLPSYQPWTSVALEPTGPPLSWQTHPVVCVCVWGGGGGGEGVL